jgi:hypothetical protein
MTEEIVVELDQGPVASEVLWEGFPARLQGEGVSAAVDQPEELFRLTSPPPVNGLFRIAYKDQGTLLALVVLPLQRIAD